MPGDLGDHRLYLLRIAHVAGDIECFATSGLDLRNRLPSVEAGLIMDRNQCALGSQSNGRRLADPRAGARYQRDFASEPALHDVLLGLSEIRRGRSDSK